MAKKFDVIAKYPNLAYIEGTLTAVLEEHTRTISQAVEDETITLDNLKEIIDYITDKCKQTPAVARFKQKVSRMTSKTEIAFFVYNTALAGENLGAGVA